jgi:hypothetical protein
MNKNRLQKVLHLIRMSKENSKENEIRRMSDSKFTPLWNLTRMSKGNY